MLGLAMEPTDATDAFDFAALRASEFSRLDNAGIAYLDYAASALYGPSQARAHGDRLVHGIFGNPHSEHLASRNSAAAQAAASAATLAFFDADPDIHDVCFTANATAAIKLVAESYRFSLRRRLILSADNHNSVNGMREFARRAQAPVSVLALEPELPLDRGSASLRAYEQASSDSAGYCSHSRSSPTFSECDTTGHSSKKPGCSDAMSWSMRQRPAHSTGSA
jgi:selenocysteine lyase/cysteine desulfurase